MRKRQNGKGNVRNFRRYFYCGVSSDVPPFKDRVFAIDFEFGIWVNAY